MTTPLSFGWDWDRMHCVPPLAVEADDFDGEPYLIVRAYGSVKAGVGWNVLWTKGDLPEGDELETLKNTMLQLVELRYWQETLDEPQGESK